MAGVTSIELLRSQTLPNLNFPKRNDVLYYCHFPLTQRKWKLDEINEFAKLGRPIEFSILT